MKATIDPVPPHSEWLSSRLQKIINTGNYEKKKIIKTVGRNILLQPL